MDAIAANAHIGSAVIPVFPLGVFKDARASREKAA
jgi:hypothetical protein